MTSMRANRARFAPDRILFACSLPIGFVLEHISTIRGAFKQVEELVQRKAYRAILALGSHSIYSE